MEKRWGQIIMGCSEIAAIVQGPECTGGGGSCCFGGRVSFFWKWWFFFFWWWLLNTTGSLGLAWHMWGLEPGSMVGSVVAGRRGAVTSYGYNEDFSRPVFTTPAGPWGGPVGPRAGSTLAGRSPWLSVQLISCAQRRGHPMINHNLQRIQRLKKKCFYLLNFSHRQAPLSSVQFYL